MNIDSYLNAWTNWRWKMQARYYQNLADKGHTGKPLTEIEIRRAVYRCHNQVPVEEISKRLEIPREVIDFWLEEEGTFKREDALILIQKGDPVERVSEFLQIPVETIKEYIQEAENPESKYASFRRSAREKNLVTDILDALNKLDDSFFFQTWVFRATGKGEPDIFGYYKGKSVAIEVKTRTGKVKEHQLDFMSRLKKHGAIVGVARSVNEAVALVKQAEIT